MRSKITTLIFGSILACNAQAATWYGFAGAGTDKAAYFFDKDTVVKESGSVTIWIKYVKEENSPDKDGSYATSLKFRYDCKRRTSQALIAVTYDKDHNHLKTFSSNPPPSPDEIIPGSVGESMWKIVCDPAFPNQKDGAYAKVGDNDVFAAAKRLFILYSDANDPAPK